MQSLHIELRHLPVADLRPAPYNPRRELKPGSPAYRKLETSLREFGLVEPLVWNARTGHVVGGHFRLRILRELGIAEVPVSVVHLTPEREKALNVVLNNREAQGQFDPAKLTELFDELQDLPELELTGFSAGDRAELSLAPLDDLPPLEQRDEVEIVLIASREVYARLAPSLDQIMREFDLECHVRG